jgi:hypothetical protein
MRFTISWWMAATALLGLNLGFVRAYLLAEKGGAHLDLFDCVFLIFFALQLGLWLILVLIGGLLGWYGLKVREQREIVADPLTPQLAEPLRTLQQHLQCDLPEWVEAPGEAADNFR